jgi:hypothetical protein
VLLDNAPVALDATLVSPGAATSIAAIGIADTVPVTVPIANPGVTTRPLTPVHPRAILHPDGSLELCWIRRARGAWSWPQQVDLPLNEQAEHYEVGTGNPDNPVQAWSSPEPLLLISSTDYVQLQSQASGSEIWVRQIGDMAVSEPLLLQTIP